MYTYIYIYIFTIHILQLAGPPTRGLFHIPTLEKYLKLTDPRAEASFRLASSSNLNFFMTSSACRGCKHPSKNADLLPCPVLP